MASEVSCLKKEGKIAEPLSSAHKAGAVLVSLGGNVFLYLGNKEGTGLEGGKNSNPLLVLESGISPDEGFGKERFHSPV